MRSCVTLVILLKGVAAVLKHESNIMKCNHLVQGMAAHRYKKLQHGKLEGCRGIRILK